jgi:hypothetical protein
LGCAAKEFVWNIYVLKIKKGLLSLIIKINTHENSKFKKAEQKGTNRDQWQWNHQKMQ